MSRAATIPRRNYALDSTEAARAVEAGLAEADWYRSPIDPVTLSKLTARTNATAARDVVLWLVLLVGSGVVAYWTLWSWWSVPALFVYGTMYGSTADPRWHECSHRTAFKTSWINDLVYYPASFLVLRDPTAWRWSHVRHHSDTFIVARDPEIILERPPRISKWLPNLLNLRNGPTSMARTLRHAAGRISPADRSYIPASEHRRVVWEARVYVGIWLALGGWCIAVGSALPLLFFVGPAFYGVWLTYLFGTTQHLGLREDVLDHRLNTRTMYLNPIARFLYWNMNYHIEHHMFPTVPYHALPQLHEEIKDDLPTPSPSMLAAYREIIPALLKQRVDPTWELPREVPTPNAPTGPPTSHIVERTFASSPTAHDGWFDVCGVDDLEAEAVARTDIGDRSLAIYRTAAGFFATDGICTHSRRVHLAGGVVVDGQIECPKHNGRFDIKTGAVVRRPPCEALVIHEVQVRSDRVLLRPTPAPAEDAYDTHQNRQDSNLDE